MSQRWLIITPVGQQRQVVGLAVGDFARKALRLALMLARTFGAQCIE